MHLRWRPSSCSKKQTCARGPSKKWLPRNQMRCNFQSYWSLNKKQRSTFTLMPNSWWKIRWTTQRRMRDALILIWSLTFGVIAGRTNPFSRKIYWNRQILFQQNPLVFFTPWQMFQLLCFSQTPGMSSSYSELNMLAGIFSKRSVVIGAGGRTWDSTCTPMETQGEQKILLDCKWNCHGKASLSGWTTIDRRSQSMHHGQAHGTQDSQLVSGHPASGRSPFIEGFCNLSLFHIFRYCFRNSCSI